MTATQTTTCDGSYTCPGPIHDPICLLALPHERHGDEADLLAWFAETPDTRSEQQIRNDVRAAKAGQTRRRKREAQLRAFRGA